jgi:hypothetical protein
LWPQIFRFEGADHRGKRITERTGQRFVLFGCEYGRRVATQCYGEPMSHAPAKSRSTTRRVLLLALAASVSVAACKGGPSSGGASGDGPDARPDADAGTDADAGPDPHTFDPSRYPRDCERDEDCVIVMPIHDCFTCCGYVSLRRGDAESDYTAVEAACRGGGSCGLFCPEPRAACFDQVCVHLPADGGLTGP